MNRAQRRAQGWRGEISELINAPRVHKSWPPKGRITAGNQKRRRKRLERDFAFRKWAADQLTKLDEELELV